MFAAHVPSEVRNIVQTNLIESMKISWDPPSYAGGLASDYYTLKWSSGANTDSKQLSCVASGCTATTTTLIQLTSGLVYSIIVTPHNSVGDGVPASASQKLTYPPRAPTDVTSSLNNSTAATIAFHAFMRVLSVSGGQLRQRLPRHFNNVINRIRHKITAVHQQAGEFDRSRL